MNTDLEFLYSEIITFCCKVSTIKQEEPDKERKPHLNFENKDLDELANINVKVLDTQMLFGSHAEMQPKETAIHVPRAKIVRKRDDIWTSEYDKILLDLLGIYKKDWERIKFRFFKLTGKKHISVSALKDRMSFLKQSSQKFNEKFSPFEDDKLMVEVEKLGTDWLKIAESFAERDWYSLKNRYYYLLRKKLT